MIKAYNAYEDYFVFKNINYQEIRLEREQLKMLRNQLFSLRTQEKKNIQMIHDRCQEIIMDKVEDEIRQIPITDLAKSFARLPLQALEVNHITTMYDLLKYNRRQLEALDGIGDETADKLMLALHRSIAAVKSQIHYRIDLEHIGIKRFFKKFTSICIQKKTLRI